jgi:hypothetical protein
MDFGVAVATFVRVVDGWMDGWILWKGGKRFGGCSCFYFLLMFFLRLAYLAFRNIRTIRIGPKLQT